MTSTSDGDVDVAEVIERTAEQRRQELFDALSPGNQTKVEEIRRTQAEIDDAQAKVTELIEKRRAQVRDLRKGHDRMSGYLIARLFDVSQTTVGNWTNGSARGLSRRHIR